VSEKEPIGVIGTGWVGLVTAACFAELGHRVVARDIVPEKIAALERGEVPIHEPDLPELIARNRERLEFTTEIEPVLEAARLIFICVQTPPTHSGDADLTAVMRAVEEIGSGEQRALVMKSTVPVGTGRRISAAAKNLAYVSCPEFLREGTAVKDFLEPDRVVIGSQPGDEWAADAVAAGYEAVGAPIVRTDVSSAEMIKLASNAFLATKISFINEIANVCDEVGADVAQVASAMGMDDRIGPKFLRPGIGFGGSCFFKDVSALKQLAGNSGYHFQLLSSVIDVNDLQKRRVIAKLTKHLGTLSGKRVALLGLAFKPDTDDMRDASSLVVAARLQNEGARVVAFDPVAEETARPLLPDVEMSASALDALEGADAAVLVTEWPEFGEIDWADAATRMRTALIVDGRNFLDPRALRAAGFTYESIGQPSADGVAGVDSEN
jgi:UDPglucose 6-dehydrogenase